jgi:hypothetical protein
MASLEHLPAELLENIFNDLSRAAHLSLCLTSKRLNSIAERHVYRSFIHNQVMNERGVKMIGRGPQDKIYLLLRALISRPWLSLCLRELVFFGDKQGCAWRETHPLTAEELLELQHLIPAIHGKNPHYESSGFYVGPSYSWHRMIEDGSIPAILTLVIVLSKNIELLKLDFTMSFLCFSAIDAFSIGKTLLSLVLESTSDRSKCFRRLRKAEFRLRYIDSLVDESNHAQHDDVRRIRRRDIGLEAIAYIWIFYVPVIQQVVLYHVGDALFEWPPKKPLPSAITLRSLSFKRSRINEQNLARILEVSPNLQHLNYFIMYCFDERHFVNCDDLVAAVTKVKQSLKILTLGIQSGFHDYMAQDGPPARVEGRIGSLSHLSELEALSISTFLLFGNSAQSISSLENTLPPKLVHFVLIDTLDESNSQELVSSGLLRRYLRSFSSDTIINSSLQKFWLWPGEFEDLFSQGLLREGIQDTIELYSRDGVCFEVLDPGKAKGILETWESGLLEEIV